MTANEPKIALVTGASRGIGAGIAQALLKAGYRVAIAYQNSADKANAVASGHQNALVIKLDVSNPESVQSAIGEIHSKWGSVDVLVNNAGIGHYKDFLQLSENDWQTMFATNLYGAVYCAQAVIPKMIEKRFGRIINISSIGGQWGGVHQVHYAASKAALLNLTKSMAKLYSQHGITSNAIAPGTIPTDLVMEELEKVPESDRIKNIPAGRLGTVEDVGDAVVFLASESAGYITGQTLNINGGLYMG